MRSKLLVLAVFLTAVLTACSSQTSPPAEQNSQTAPASRAPEIKVASVSRVNEWDPGEMEGLTLTKGVSVTAVGGNFTKFSADPGYEIVVVKMSVPEGASVALSDVSVTDDKGKNYPTIAGRSALNSKNSELGFAVPVKTVLTRVDLNKTASFNF